MQSGQPDISTASTSRLHRSASGTSKSQSTSTTTQQTASAIQPTGHLYSLNQPTSLFHQWNIQAVVDIYTNPAASQCNPANRTSLQPQPADFIVPPVEQPSRSQHLQQPSREPVQSGQPDISTGSTSRLHRSASGTSRPQSTSTPTQQPASAIRPTGHLYSLNQPTSSFRQWNIQAAVNIYTNPAASQCNPANRTSLQPQPADFIVPPVEHPSRSRHLHQPSSQPVQPDQPDISAASTSRLHCSTSGTSKPQSTSTPTQQPASAIRPTGHLYSLNQPTSSFRQWNIQAAVNIYTNPASSQCNPANRTSLQPQPRLHCSTSGTSKP